MNSVILFGEKVVLDKVIYVTLDNSWKLFDMCPDALKDYCYAGDYLKTCQAIKENRPNIITPITKFVSSSVMELGYEIVVQCKDKYVKFSELLMGSNDGSFGREIRETQSWERMLYGGCFDLDLSI